jgi:hypothetical protein
MFVCVLFKDAVSGSGYIAANGWFVYERRIRKGVERSRRKTIKTSRQSMPGPRFATGCLTIQVEVVLF